MEKTKEEDFVPCGQHTDLYTAYMSVSSILQHMRRLNEVDEKSLDSIEKNRDDEMRIDDSPVRDAEPILFGEDTRDGSSLPPALELLPEPRSPISEAESPAGQSGKLFERFMLN